MTASMTGDHDNRRTTTKNDGDKRRRGPMTTEEGRRRQTTKSTNDVRGQRTYYDRRPHAHAATAAATCRLFRQYTRSTVVLSSTTGAGLPILALSMQHTQDATHITTCSMRYTSSLQCNAYVACNTCTPKYDMRHETQYAACTQHAATGSMLPVVRSHELIPLRPRGAPWMRVCMAGGGWRVVDGGWWRACGYRQSKASPQCDFPYSRAPRRKLSRVRRSMPREPGCASTAPF